MERVSEMLYHIKMTYQDASEYVTWSSVLTYSSILAATWLSYKAFIEPFFSSMRKIPGTSFNPFLGNMRELMKGEAMEATIKILKDHGPIARYYFMFGRERLLIGDPQAMKHIVVTNCKNYIKPPTRLALMRMIMGNGLVLSEGATHAAHKRLMSPTFNIASIRKMIPVFVRRVRVMISHWEAACDKSEGPVDTMIHRDVCKTTLDVIGEIAFGYDFKSFERESDSTEAFQRILTGAGLSWRLAIPFYENLPFSDVQRFKSDIDTMNKIVMDILNHKRATMREGSDEAKSTLDMLSKLLLARDEDGSGLSAEDIRSEVMTIMLAGHETTSVGMAWCLLMMATHPNIQEKARAEVREVLPSGDEGITLDNIEQMKYIDCIVKETLRLYPPVPMTLRQALNDDVIQGKHTPAYHIPAKTIILLAVGPMMRLPELFERSEEFWPERFLDPAVEADMYAYLPFLIGPRMCLGYKFALVEMKVMLAMLLRDLTFDLIPGLSFRRTNRITMRPDPSLQLNVSRAGE